MRRLRILIAALLWPPLLLAAVVGSAAAVAAQLGRESLAWDILTHFAPLWLLLAAAPLAAAVGYRGSLRWLLVAAALPGVIAAGVLIAPEFTRDAGPQAAGSAGGQLKIVQFNAWHSNPDPGALLDWLDAERPDIAVLEENTPQLSRAIAARPGWHVSCGRCEVVILSRGPALSVQAPRVERGGPAPVTRVAFRDERGPFEVIGVHNAWPVDADQAFQERRLAAEIQAADDRDRLIVTGDFNSTPWSFARRRWDVAFGLPRRERALPTWPAQAEGLLRWIPLAFLPIDHVYAGRAWATVSVRRGPRLSSDHYPVVVILAPISPP
jgi:endonuclease/exonuclease/phosphatase (EEP) superfamily protein YafD